MIALPEVETIEQLDWQPGCESTQCRVGHPVATHVQFFFGPILECGCYPLSQLICAPCVERITAKRNVSVWACGYCGRWFRGFKADFMRIEPLP